MAMTAMTKIWAHQIETVGVITMGYVDYLHALATGEDAGDKLKAATDETCRWTEITKHIGLGDLPKGEREPHRHAYSQWHAPQSILWGQDIGSARQFHATKNPRGTS